MAQVKVPVRGEGKGHHIWSWEGGPQGGADSPQVWVGGAAAPLVCTPFRGPVELWACCGSLLAACPPCGLCPVLRKVYSWHCGVSLHPCPGLWTQAWVGWTAGWVPWARGPQALCVTSRLSHRLGQCVGWVLGVCAQGRFQGCRFPLLSALFAPFSSSISWAPVFLCSSHSVCVCVCVCVRGPC